MPLDSASVYTGDGSASSRAPYLVLVHPDDRERTAAEAAAISNGKTTMAFENRFARKDSSYKVLEWTSTPVVEDGVMYAVGRDMTERREAEAELQRLADEQAALRRVASLVVRGVPAAERSSQPSPRSSSGSSTPRPR